MGRGHAGGSCPGAVDAWLLAGFGGEVDNASRTRLLNVHTRQWDPGLLELFLTSGRRVHGEPITDADGTRPAGRIRRVGAYGVPHD